MPVDFSGRWLLDKPKRAPGPLFPTQVGTHLQRLQELRGLCQQTVLTWEGDTLMCRQGGDKANHGWKHLFRLEVCRRAGWLALEAT
uniref:Uncharacterized protein n=1 Tax=Electrophorus electricus TaxID=8005 RepID=A0AAY5EHL7_ELEEL